MLLGRLQPSGKSCWVKGWMQNVWMREGRRYGDIKDVKRMTDTFSCTEIRLLRSKQVILAGKVAQLRCLMRGRGARAWRRRDGQR